MSDVAPGIDLIVRRQHVLARCMRPRTCSYNTIGLQAGTQPFSKGGYIGGMSQTMAAVMLWALAHSPSRGVWGHAPPENVGILDSLRAILRHSDGDYH